MKTGRGLYGLTMAAIEQITQQGLACVTHMSLEVHDCTCVCINMRVLWS